jgi:hypothetical protein
MGTKHTPGPWSINNNIGKKGEIGVLADAAPCIIATMGNAKAWPAEARANAALIASAPELFETLKALAVAAGEADALQHAGLTVPAEVWSNIYKANIAARAAIAQAETGE